MEDFLQEVQILLQNLDFQESYTILHSEMSQK